MGKKGLKGARKGGDAKAKLILEGISYSYQNAAGTTKVLSDVSAEFSAGKVYAIVGESGSGKTTLLSLIAALDKLQEGDIRFCSGAGVKAHSSEKGASRGKRGSEGRGDSRKGGSGKSDSRERSIKEIGAAEFRLKYVNVVFQQYNLIKYMTAKENVEVAIDFDERKADPMPYLEEVGLSREEGDRLIGKLSGGQQQRVAIARALASESPIIVADEPTGNLDEDTEKRIIEIFQRLAHEDGKIVIIVTHSKQVSGYADEVMRLRRGKLS